MPADNFNLDHVIVGPTGVFAIETKPRRAGRAQPGRRPDEITFDVALLIFPWGQDVVGLEPARHLASWRGTWLRDTAGEPVLPVPVLTFPGWNVTTTATASAAVAEVSVVSPSAIPGLVRNRPGMLNDLQIDHIAKQLAVKCRDVEF